MALTSACIRRHLTVTLIAFMWVVFLLTEFSLVLFEHVRQGGAVHRGVDDAFAEDVVNLTYSVADLYRLGLVWTYSPFCLVTSPFWLKHIKSSCDPSPLCFDGETQTAQKSAWCVLSLWNSPIAFPSLVLSDLRLQIH